MKILFCLDYTTLTKKIINTAAPIIHSFKDAEITILHVVDETLFTATTGFETRLNEIVGRESKDLKELCLQHFGQKIHYIEEWGLPRLVIDNMLEETEHDMLVIGSHSRHGLGVRLMGSFAEHIVRISKKPVLIIP